jgi:hypothetical protein
MKLTKNELLFLLDSIDPKKWEAENLSGFVRRAIYNNHLDIEGYQRAEWIKLDKNDLKTFPQIDGEEVLLYVTCDNGEKIIIQAKVNWIDNNECYFSDFNGDEVHDNVAAITHWMSSPKPPVE